MRIAVVGPAYPFKGGIAQHDAVMAAELAARGHEIRLENWNRQYPRRLYPGQLTVEKPEIPLPAAHRRRLSWNRPDSWFRVGRDLRGQDIVVIAHVNSIQTVPYRALVAGLRGSRTKVVVVAHNVLPHERRRTDVVATRMLLDAVDRVIVHSPQQADLAGTITRTEIVTAPIAPFLPPGFRQGHPEPGEHRRLLFFGFVRPYKGLDVLLEAMALAPPDVRLRVAGEFWGGTAATTELIDRLGLAERVELAAGYVAAERVPEYFRDVDALVAPYRKATGSQLVWTAFQMGVPVIATRTGLLAADITPGYNGLTADPGDPESLAMAINDFYRPGEPERLRAGVTPVDPGPYWDVYAAALTERFG